VQEDDELVLTPAPHGAMELAKVGCAAGAVEAQSSIDFRTERQRMPFRASTRIGSRVVQSLPFRP
jgi:hypothetical protein